MKPLNTLLIVLFWNTSYLTTEWSNKIAVCSGCKSHPNGQLSHRLASMPTCIEDYLSPVYLHTSLGRSAGANPFVEYRSLTGRMGYSKNRRAFTLCSGMLDTFSIITLCLWMVTCNNPYVGCISLFSLPFAWTRWTVSNKLAILQSSLGTKSTNYPLNSLHLNQSQ